MLNTKIFLFSQWLPCTQNTHTDIPAHVTERAASPTFSFDPKQTAWDFMLDNWALPAF